MNEQKLLLHDKVEVRQLEEGLRGSWHTGVVVGVSELCRSVEYDELLCETGDTKLIEAIPVTKAIEGFHRRRHVPSTYRGRIRPPPPQPEPDSCKLTLSFGICVDVFFEDAWWEGVVFDHHDDSNERFVYFPDEEDERKFHVSDLRVSCVWDEYLGIWRERGVWVLVELAKALEVGGHLSDFIKRVWARLRFNYGFLKMISEWTSGVQNLWSGYLMEVVDEIAVESSLGDLFYHTIPVCLLRKGGKKLKNSPQIVQNTNVNGFNLVRPRHNIKQKASSGQPRSKKQSLIINLKCKKSGCPRRHKDKEHRFQVGSSFGENDMAARASRMQRNSAVKGKCDRILSGCSSLCEDKVNVSVPLQRKLPLKIKVKLQTPESRIASEAEGNQLLVDNQSRNKETSRDIFLLQSNEIGQGNFKRLTNGCLNRNKIKAFQVAPSKRNRQRLQKRSTLKKSKSIVTYKHKNNKCTVDSLRMVKELTYDISPVQDNQPVSKRRNMTKLKQHKKSRAMGFPFCRLRQRNKEASHVLTNQRNCSTIGERHSKKFHETNMQVKAPPEEEVKVLDAIQTQDGVFASCCPPTLPFVNSGRNIRLKDMVSPPRKRKRKRGYRGCRQSDSICMVCQDDGEIICCDHCPTSYHLNCIDLKDIPDGKWFCPSCCCGLCGSRDPNSDNHLFTDVCHQCTRQYHVVCLNKVGDNPLEKFCSKNCFKLCDRLHQLLGISYETRVEGVTWKMIRSTINDCSSHNTSRTDSSTELCRALEVMHECFQPVIEPHTQRDLVQDVFLNSVSEFKRLDFRGFYVMVLQKGDEMVSVATVRIHGLKVAEMPLIATPFQYRRQGMCRLLVQELEKMLTKLGIERLVLPAISQLAETWKSSFGFSEMSRPERLEFLGYPFLCFQGTKMFHKVLSKSMAIKETTGASQEMGGNTPRIYQAYQVGLDSDKKFSGFCYNRKSKKIIGKENVVKGSNGNTDMCKCVYKRRKILACSDSVIDRIQEGKFNDEI